MNREELIAEIEAYLPYNEQEQKDRKLILECLRRFEDVFDRSNELCHMTASGWTVNTSRDKVLMAYHNIYDSWSWLGGHADGDTDLARVAEREVREESGLNSARAVSGRIFSLEVLTVDGHEKRGSYVPSHLHLNLTYLIEADEHETLSAKADENSAVQWFRPEEALLRSTEPWFVKRIYRKLIEKTSEYSETGTEL